MKSVRSWSTSGFMVVLALAVASGAAIAAEYVEGTTPEIFLMSGSADGTTNTLAEAIAAYNAANNTTYDISSFNGGDLAAYALIKEGDGTLVMDTAISGFTGPIVVKDGVVACMGRYMLGADNTSSHIYVRDGATMWFNRILGADGRTDTVINENRNYHVKGTGHNDQGALNTIALRPNGSYNYAKLYGTTLSLDGNATIIHPAWSKMFSTANLNGFTLTVKSPTSYLSGSNWCNASVQIATLNGPGKMVLDDTIYYLQSTTFNDTTEGNEIVVGTNSGFRFWRSTYTGRNWTIRFTGENCWLWGDNTDGMMRFNQEATATVIYNSQKNRITNPMVLDGGTLKMRTQSGLPDNWIFIEGPISGNGNINLAYETMTFPAGRMSLLNPANSFTGTATVDKGLIYVYEPGTLPSTVNLVVSRSHALNAKLQKADAVPEYFGFDFVSAQPQTLSTLTFTSVADSGTYHSGRIQGGVGTFSKIDKLSPNTMEYYSGIGSPLLNVEGGTVKLPRGPAPGLWEGTNMSEIVNESHPGNTWHAVFNSRRVATNLVARGALLANFALFPHYAARFNTAVTYSGYIWNRTDQDQTVTLVSSLIGQSRLYVDDEPVIEQDTWATTNYDQIFTNLTLTTGPHKFEYRMNTSGPCTSNSWDRMLGFAIDPLARGPSSDTNHFYTVVDPGDGSIFSRSIDEADLPHFGEMRFAADTTLDLNGNAYVAGTISGLPNVISSADDALAAPSLTITNRFVVNAADIAADSTRKLSLAMPLTFGANAGVTVTNLETLARGTYTLAEVTGEGNTLTVADGFRQRCDFGGSRKWWVRAVDNKIELCPAPGFVILIR